MESLIKIFLSFFYCFFVQLRYFLYNSKIFKKKSLPAKVICIGNITAGGTGKTSAVIYLSKYFSSKKYKVAVISRGYRRKFNKVGKNTPVIVSDGNSILTSVEYSGDEPYLMAKNLQNIPVIVCSDRFLAGKTAIDKYDTEIILMDDGFQHLKLKRDIDILLIDCLNPFSNGFLLPAGLLREPLSSLKRADIFILTNSNFISEEDKSDIVKKIRRYNNSSPIFLAFHKPLSFIKLVSDEILDISFMKGKDVISLSSIGNPESFEKTLESIGLNILKKIRFPDHHWFTIDEIRKILENKKYVVTTEKDAVRIKKLFLDNINLLEKMLILKIVFEVQNEEKLFEEIQKKCSGLP